MTNRVAIGIALAVGLFIAADLSAGTGMSLFLARKLADLTEYLAFWR